MSQQAMTGSKTISRARLGRAVKTLLACTIGAFPLLSQALPVIPNAAGFGMETPAGRGGKIYKVTNLNASGAGSLKECVAASGPRVCVFEVSGIIKLTTDLSITNPYITIAGQTAPSPGIMLRGAALRVNASDVLVQHIRVRAGDDKIGPDPDNRDALKIEANGKVVKNIVIDHCSFSWGVDEVVSMWYGWDGVTIRNSIIAEGLRDTIHPSGTAGYGMLIGPWKGRVSVIGNLLAHNGARNPLSRGTEVVFVNNVVYGGGNYNLDLQSEGLTTKTTVIGNAFVRGPDSSTANKPVHLRNTGNWPLPSTSRVYVDDNSAVEASSSDPWSVADATGGQIPDAMKAKSPPVWPAGLTRLPASTTSNLSMSGASSIETEVLRRVGARPADRDSVDTRIINQVRNRSGKIINCVAANGTEKCKKNAGGWPTLAQNRRALTLPENPNGKNAVGYTNLEVWLQQMAAKVEGRTATPNAPVLVTR